PSIGGYEDGSHGTVTLHSGELGYRPADDWFGTDSFDYEISDGELSATATVTVTVTPVNDAPVAGDDWAYTFEDESVTIPVLLTDVDPEDDALSIASYEQPGHGTVTKSGSKLVYTPDSDWFGADGFSYEVTDTGDGGTDPITVGPVTVDVTVNPVNDAPHRASVLNAQLMTSLTNDRHGSRMW
ncbi:MAG: tandem-95 repeat protein, partial [Propionibacteriaceae bacterium]|nr:tandem-95 repeat protein [Propionibacteriaceae bacterium]